MLLALNTFSSSTPPAPSTNRTPIGLLLALTRPAVSSEPPPAATARTPIGLLLALTRPAVPSEPPPAATARTPIGLLLALTRPAVPVEPPIEPVEPPASNYAGGVSRGRMIRKHPRKRKREELEELLDALGVPPPEVPAVPVSPPPEILQLPGLLADVPTPPRTVLQSLPDEDEDEIALLLALLS